MNKFIYVFSQSDRDKMLFKGFLLLKSDPNNNMYVFLNGGDLALDDLDISYILSDRLTF